MEVKVGDIIPVTPALKILQINGDKVITVHEQEYEGRRSGNPDDYASVGYWTTDEIKQKLNYYLEKI